MTRSLSTAAWVFLTLVAVASVAGAQEFRGSVLGRIIDPLGGVIVGATVTLTNVDTNAAQKVVTTERGVWQALYLSPGSYRVTVESPGFKSATRTISVSVGSRLELDMTLELGAETVVVEVVAETPLLEQRSASAGQVVDGRRISELPLGNGVAYTLVQLAPGVQFDGNLLNTKPADGGNLNAVTVSGIGAANEFTLDGAPNMTAVSKTNGSSGDSRAQDVGFSPPADAVQEFKVETFSVDAQQGHNAGAYVNVSLKSGTNKLRGTGSYFNRDESRAAQDYFRQRTGQQKDDITYHRGTFTLGGPIARDKTFFFFAYERIRDAVPEALLLNTLSEAERRGDFSQLLAAGIRIYDPLTARLDANGRVVRDPFPNNIIPQSRLNPIALKYVNLLPLPNNTAFQGPLGEQNFTTENPRVLDYDSETIRVDHQFNANHRSFIRYIRYRRDNVRNRWTDTDASGSNARRQTQAVNLDHLAVLNDKTLLNVRASGAYYDDILRLNSLGYASAADLGFSTSVLNTLGNPDYLPHFQVGSLRPLAQANQATGWNTPNYVYMFQATLTKLLNGHSVKTGYEFRLNQANSDYRGFAGGTFTFAATYAKESDTSPNLFGQDRAALLLGMPTSGSIDRNEAMANQMVYHGMFVQDDWRVNDRLTLNLGLRYEVELPTYERDNRNVWAFDATSPSPIEEAAKAAYAANPIPELSPSQFQVKGGLQFVADAQGNVISPDGSRGYWKADLNNILPRLGFAFKIDEKTSFRGGWGLFTMPIGLFGIYPAGYSIATSMVPTLDRGLTFQADLNNPFPTGVQTPTGSSAGLGTNLGLALGAGGQQGFGADLLSNREFRNPQVQRWELSLQRELPGRLLLEARYAGSRSRGLMTQDDFAPLPNQYLSTLPLRDQATINALGRSVPNPFRNLLPGTGLNGATTTVSRLLTPYPHFNSITMWYNRGEYDFQGASLSVAKRFSKGYSVLAHYSFSRGRERTSKLNPGDTEYEETIGSQSVPHRIAGSGILELPFGRGRKFGSGWSAPLEALLGGWQIQGTYSYSTGKPIVWGNIYYDGDLGRLTMRRVDKNAMNTAVFDVANFYLHDAAVQTNGVDDPVKQRADSRIQLASHYRTLPTMFGSLREQSRHITDFSAIKNFRFGNRFSLQVRLEALNAFDFQIFGPVNTNPASIDFGKVTDVANQPREIQLGVRFSF